MEEKNLNQEGLFEKNFPIFLTLAFFTLSLIAVINHEMWRDEIQAWLIARDSNSLMELFRNLKYEGHPGLWHLLLMPLTRVSDSPFLMQILHLSIASATIFVFTKYSPFSNLQKLLFTFGYYPFFEYGIISRNYGISVFLVFVFCSLFKNCLTNFLAIGFVLFCLSHTNIFGLIISIVIFFILIIHLIIGVDQEELGRYIPKIAGGFLFILAGIITSIYQLIPPEDSGIALGWFVRFNPHRLKLTAFAFLHAYFPVPKIELNFWNTSALHSDGLILILALFLIWFSLSIIKKPVAFSAFAGATSGFALFFYAKYPGFYRHHGFLFVVFMASAWISHYCRETHFFPSIKLPKLKHIQFLSRAITFILIIHVIGTGIAVCMDQRFEFSSGKSVAEYIKSKGLENMPIIGHPSFAASTVLGYLGHGTFYYPDGERNGSFVRWDADRMTKKLNAEAVVSQALRYASENRKDTLLILNYEIKDKKILKDGAAFLKSFTGSIERTENYYLYLVSSKARKSSI